MPIKIPLHDDVPAVDFEEAAEFVLELLSSVPEFRREKGRQIELKGTLALAVFAMAAGKTSYRKIARYGRRREHNLIPLLGLTRAPSYSTLRRLLIGADSTALREVLKAVALKLVTGKRRLVVSVDGKSMRGSREENSAIPHVVSVMDHNLGVIMDAKAVPNGSSELATGRRLLNDLLASTPQILVETGDALYAESSLARKTVGQGRHYVFKLKKTS